MRQAGRISLATVLVAATLLALLVVVRQQNRLAGRLRAVAERLDRLEGAGRAPSSAAAPSSNGDPAPRSSPYDESYPAIGRHGGTLRVALTSPPDTFNPITGKSLAGFFVSLQICEPLFVLDSFTAEPVPVLAESAVPSDGGHTWTVRLREGLRWSDGRPLTADDVIFSFETLLDPNVVSYSTREFLYATPRGEERVVFEKVDDRTVRFRQPLPYVAFPNKLAFKAIVPKHRLAEARERGEFQTAWNVTTSPDEIVGSGPFLLERYTPGADVVLRRNPLHWRRDAAGQPLPYLDRIVWVVVENPDAAVLQFQAGALDVLSGKGSGIRGTDVAVLKAREEAGGFRLRDVGPGVDFTFLAFNQNTRTNPASGKPYVDPRKLRWFRDSTFRRAIAHAVDREAIVGNVYHGLAEPADSVYSRGTGRFHNPGVTRYPSDLEKARGLLRAMGFKDRDGDGAIEDEAGTPLEFSVAWAERTAEEKGTLSILVDRLAEIGVRARPRRVDPGTLTRLLFDTFDWEAILSTDSGAASDPKGDDPLWSSTVPYHFWFPSQERPSTPWEARIDAIFREASLEFDEARRMALLFEFQEIVAREVPMILTVQRRVIYAVRDRVGNFRAAPAEPNFLWNAYEIFVK